MMLVRTMKKKRKTKSISLSFGLANGVWPRVCLMLTKRPKQVQITTNTLHKRKFFLKQEAIKSKRRKRHNEFLYIRLNKQLPPARVRDIIFSLTGKTTSASQSRHRKFSRDDYFFGMCLQAKVGLSLYTLRKAFRFSFTHFRIAFFTFSSWHLYKYRPKFFQGFFFRIGN